MCIFLNYTVIHKYAILNKKQDLNNKKNSVALIIEQLIHYQLFCNRQNFYLFWHDLTRKIFYPTACLTLQRNRALYFLNNH